MHNHIPGANMLAHWDFQKKMLLHICRAEAVLGKILLLKVHHIKTNLQIFYTQDFATSKYACKNK